MENRQQVWARLHSRIMHTGGAALADEYQGCSPELRDAIAHELMWVMAELEIHRWSAAGGEPTEDMIATWEQSTSLLVAMAGGIDNCPNDEFYRGIKEVMDAKSK